MCPGRAPMGDQALVSQLAHGVLTHHSGISLKHSCTYLNLKPVADNWASLMVQVVKNPPLMQETWVQSLGWEDSPGGGHGNPLHYS